MEFKARVKWNERHEGLIGNYKAPGRITRQEPTSSTTTAAATTKVTRTKFDGRTRKTIPCNFHVSNSIYEISAEFAQRDNC